MKKLSADWKPLIKMPENIPSVSFLMDKDLLKEYNGRVKSDFNDNSVLKVLSYENRVVVGSNPFAVTLVNYIVSPLGYRTATHADLEKALSLNALPLRDQYEDTALVLRSEDNQNEYLAKKLAEQVNERGHNLLEPLVIPLSGLELVKDSSSPYELAFKLTDKSEIIVAPVLASANGSYIDQIDESTGLPTVAFPNVRQGNRKLWTRISGLSRFYLDIEKDINSYDENLGRSNSNGRVVVVSGQTNGANFLRDYQSKLESELETRKTQLDKWFATSIKQMPKI